MNSTTSSPPPGLIENFIDAPIKPTNNLAPPPPRRTQEPIKFVVWSAVLRDKIYIIYMVSAVLMYDGQYLVVEIDGENDEEDEEDVQEVEQGHTVHTYQHQSDSDSTKSIEMKG